MSNIIEKWITDNKEEKYVNAFVLSDEQIEFLNQYNKLQTYYGDIKNETNELFKSSMSEYARDLKEQLHQFPLSIEQASQLVRMDLSQVSQYIKNDHNNLGDGLKIHGYLSPSLKQATTEVKRVIKHDNLVRLQKDFDTNQKFVTSEDLAKRTARVNKSTLAVEPIKLEKEPLKRAKKEPVKNENKDEPAWLKYKHWSENPALKKYLVKETQADFDKKMFARDEKRTQKADLLADYKELKFPTSEQMHSAIENKPFNTLNKNELRDFFNTTKNQETTAQYADSSMTTGEHRLANRHLENLVSGEHSYHDRDTTNSIREMNSRHLSETQNVNYHDNKEKVDATHNFEKAYLTHQFNDYHNLISNEDALLDHFKHRQSVVFADRIKMIEEKFPEATARIKSEHGEVVSHPIQMESKPLQDTKIVEPGKATVKVEAVQEQAVQPPIKADIQHTVIDKAPTEKQVLLANDIYKKLGTEPKEEVMNSFNNIRVFLNDNYKTHDKEGHKYTEDKVTAEKMREDGNKPKLKAVRDEPRKTNELEGVYGFEDKNVLSDMKEVKVENNKAQTNREKMQAIQKVQPANTENKMDSFSPKVKEMVMKEIVNTRKSYSNESRGGQQTKKTMGMSM